MGAASIEYLLVVLAPSAESGSRDGSPVRKHLRAVCRACGRRYGRLLAGTCLGEVWSSLEQTWYAAPSCTVFNAFTGTIGSVVGHVDCARHGHKPQCISSGCRAHLGR